MIAPKTDNIARESDLSPAKKERFTAHAVFGQHWLKVIIAEALYLLPRTSGLARKQEER